jgi:hypothetical protein
MAEKPLGESSGVFVEADGTSLRRRSPQDIGIKLTCDLEHGPGEKSFADVIIVGNDIDRRIYEAACDLAGVIAGAGTANGVDDLRG